MRQGDDSSSSSSDSDEDENNGHGAAGQANGTMNQGMMNMGAN